MAVVEHGLTDRIITAAEAAIRAHERAIERDPSEVRSVVIELTLKRDRRVGATISEADCYLHRRISTNALLDLGHGGPKGGS